MARCDVAKLVAMHLSGKESSAGKVKVCGVNRVPIVRISFCSAENMKLKRIIY